MLSLAEWLSCHITPKLSCGRVKQERARSARYIHSVARQLQRTLDITVEDLPGSISEGSLFTTR